MWTMLQDNGYINKAQGLYKIPWSRDFWPKVEDNSLDAANEQSASRKGYSRCYQNRRHRAGRQDNGSGDRFSFRSFFWRCRRPRFVYNYEIIRGKAPKKTPEKPKKTRRTWNWRRRAGVLEVVNPLSLWPYVVVILVVGDICIFLRYLFPGLVLIEQFVCRYIVAYIYISSVCTDLEAVSVAAPISWPIWPPKSAV